MRGDDAPSDPSAQKVILTTDGACIGNPGPGGWACVLRFPDQVGEMFGCAPQTTNNRMELTAVIEGLRALSERCQVELSTDSQYVQRGITEWLAKWQHNGWRTSTKKDVANRDLWMELDDLRRRHKVAWHWVKGHARHKDNIRCDELAYQAARSQSASGGIRVRQTG